MADSTLMRDRFTKRQKAFFYSFAVLAAPAASTCGPTPTAGPLPCDVDAILRERCQGCHSSTPKFGAPMPLTTLDEILAQARNTPSRSVREMIKARINDVNNPMPPKGQTPLKDLEHARLNQWLDTSTPAGTAPCTNLPPPGGLNSLTGPEYLPCTPTKHFKANGSATGGKYAVASSSSTANYQCFSFQSPFAANEHATAFAPVIDEDRILHHWLLFGAQGPAGSGALGCQLATANPLVAGWAPGGSNAVNDPDVSLKLSFPWYILQIHYVNNTGSTLPDGSGVSFCTGAPRQNVAGMVTLGTTNISIAPFSTGTATGLCNGSGGPSLATDNSTPMTVVSTSPHMHLTGKSFRTEHFGFNDLSNIPDWNFDVQIHYPVLPRRVVRPGETLRTTCTYTNPNSTRLTFGPETTRE
ncbi:MAG TPA: hypothetical protein VK524_33060, partial [Polyangiaceae bacterium]|nr:hypothetical protein [Polyangiaceae bacterium]